MYSVNWITRIVSIPKADLVLIDVGPPEVRELDLETLWRELRGIESSEEGAVFPPLIGDPDGMVRHQPPLSISTVTIGRVVEIINGFQLEFEDGLYSVNVVGGNSNVSDVVVRNQVSVNTANTAGLTAPGFTAADALRLLELYQSHALDPLVPVLYRKTPARNEFGGVVQEAVKDSFGNLTVTRL